MAYNLLNEPHPAREAGNDGADAPGFAAGARVAEDAWDRMDYEVGPGPLGAAYWEQSKTESTRAATTHCGACSRMDSTPSANVPHVACARRGGPCGVGSDDVRVGQEANEPADGGGRGAPVGDAAPNAER